MSPGEGGVGMGGSDEVVGDDVLRLTKPPLRELIQHLSDQLIKQLIN